MDRFINQSDNESYDSDKGIDEKVKNDFNKKNQKLNKLENTSDPKDQSNNETKNSVVSNVNINSNDKSKENATVKKTSLNDLRKQLSQKRDNLFAIQNQEDDTIQNYSALEIEQQQKINAIRKYCRKYSSIVASQEIGQKPTNSKQQESKQSMFSNLKKDPKYIQANQKLDELFEKVIQKTEENKILREQIVSNDHHNFIKISEEQNRASDARFKFDGDRLLYEQTKKELEQAKLENQELKELAESIRDEFIGLNSQKKTFEEEFNRMNMKLNEQKTEFNALTEVYIETKQKNDLLNKEREKHEEILRKTLQKVTEKRQSLSEFVEGTKARQKEEDKKTEEVVEEIEKLEMNRKRLDEEVLHLAQLNARRKEQLAQFNLLLNT